MIRKSHAARQPKRKHPPDGIERAYLAEVEGRLNRGTYVNPHAGRTGFGDFAQQRLGTRTVEARTTERTVSMLRAHILPKWGDWPLGRVDFMSVQEWVTGLSRELATTTVAKCYRLLSMILRTAVRARLIATNPAEGVRLPRGRSRDVRPVTISREDSSASCSRPYRLATARSSPLPLVRASPGVSAPD